MISWEEAVPSTPIEFVRRLTEQDVTPGTFDTAFSTRDEQAAQLMPVMLYCSIAVPPYEILRESPLKWYAALCAAKIMAIMTISKIIMSSGFMVIFPLKILQFYVYPVVTVTSSVSEELRQARQLSRLCPRGYRVQRRFGYDSREVLY